MSYVSGNDGKPSCAYDSEGIINGEGYEMERSSCAKRPTLLESYLDDISNKSDCTLPPRLAQGGDLLENTFK